MRMIHRPADSRLLTNLLSHEKDYSKHLSILLDYSHSSLASFSAYASASIPPTSQVIIAVAGALAGADDALRNYAWAVERWQEQLKTLKDMEDDVGNIMRDREILVTRLIKASKSQKPPRDSILGGTSSPSGSSLNIPKPEVQVGHKLSAAQADLQACEAHLAAKEQELNAFRMHTIRSGLQARCTAMVECGWKWGEMGKEGIRALEGLDTVNGNGSPSMHPYIHHRSQNGHGKDGSSDILSIAPSQSASQVGHTSPPGTRVDTTWAAPSPSPVAPPSQTYTLQIPPAHAISEYAVPNGTAHPATIAEEPGGSSEEEEVTVPLEVHDNPRFQGKAKASTASSTTHPRRHSLSLRGSKAKESKPSDSYSTRSESPTKKRGVLGSLAALFHVGSSRSEADHSPQGSPSKSHGRWHTRIDKNLAAVSRGDSSDDEGPARSHLYEMRANSPTPILLNSPKKEKEDQHDDEMAKLKKSASKRSSVQTQSPSRMASTTDKGYASDTVSESVSKARKKSIRQRTVSKPPDIDGFGGSLRVADEAQRSPGGARLKKSPAVDAVLAAEGAPSLSRNSSTSKQSVTSVASAPARTTQAAHTGLGRPKGESLRKRTASLDVQPSTPKAVPSAPGGHKPTASTPSTTSAVATRSLLVNASGEPSLMSIVEGISRMNREVAFKQDPSGMLLTPQAPGPINIALSESLGELPVVKSHSQPRPHLHTPHSQVDGPQPNGSPLARKARERKKDGSHQKQGENIYRDSRLMPASLSAPSLPMNGSASASAAVAPSPSMPNSFKTKPLPKMPLRSALRNPSRSPSPSPAPRNDRPSIDTGAHGRVSPIPLNVTPQPPKHVISPAEAVPRPAPVNPPPMIRRESDVSSISSYATGREEFEDEELEPQSPPQPPRTPPPPPPPPPQAPPKENGNAMPMPNGHGHGYAVNGSDLLHSTASTVQTGEQQQPRRRKSVRMSLPPTFSTTPPAIDDTDEDEDKAQSKHAPWAAKVRQEAGWGSRIDAHGARDVWADLSEDEDEEYSAAKRMLARLGGGGRN